jgi:biotin transport system substrate-specific component
MSDSAETLTPSVPVEGRRRRDHTRSLAIGALLCALLAASAWIKIPLPFTPVPLTLQVFVVCLAALLLPPAEVALAMGVYLLLGAAGVPVFSGGTGGIGVLLGPTGGYLVGFFVGAFLGSAARVGMRDWGGSSLGGDIAAVSLTILGVYGIGWTQLMLVAGLSPMAALVAGVVPFIVADAIKAAAAIVVARTLRRTGLV